MPLTDTACRNASCPPDRKQARYADTGGLYLEVSASGSRRWFWKFRIAGVEKKFALGSYPDVSLAAARKARDAAKAQKASGINPIQARQVVKLKAAVNTGDTFRETALEWFDKHHARWSGHYATREKRNLEKDLFPYFAARRISEIEAIELLAALRRVEERGALDVAGRVLMTARAVWRYAVATARTPRDITADLKGALTPHKKRHFAAITDPACPIGNADSRHPGLPGRSHRAYGASTGAHAFSTPERTASGGLGGDRSRRSALERACCADEAAYRWQATW